MILPISFILIIPILLGFMFGINIIFGIIVGFLIISLPLAVSLGNSG
jgi:hypothetical protein